jgi:hypothetical protein
MPLRTKNKQIRNQKLRAFCVKNIKKNQKQNRLQKKPIFCLLKSDNHKPFDADRHNLAFGAILLSVLIQP